MAHKFSTKKPEKRRSKTLKPETIAALLPCMDYLHGDVVGDDFRAACQYEYARESNVLPKAAQMLRDNRTADAGEILFRLEAECHDASCDASWLGHTDWSFIWQCPSFPAKSWNQLSEAERADLLCALPLSTTTPRALRLGEVMFLTRYLDQLKEMAERAAAESKEAHAAGKPRQKVYPILN